MCCLPEELFLARFTGTSHPLHKQTHRFLSPANQRVTDTLIDTVFTDTNGGYTAKDIKRSVHRYYESRRRLGIEELPDRQGKAAEQKKKRKYRARQQRAHDRWVLNITHFQSVLAYCAHMWLCLSCN